MSKIDYEYELEQNILLYRKIEMMSEQQIQDELCIDDSKEEILEDLQEEIDFLEKRIEDEHASYSGRRLDPAFNSWEEVYSGSFNTLTHTL